MEAPRAPRRPAAATLHGETRVDDYAWLRDKRAPAVTGYLEAENAYAEDVLAHTRPLQRRLYDEFLGRTQETDLEVPSRRDDYFYYQRTQAGLQYPLVCRKHGSVDADEQVLLDLNRLGAGREYLELGIFRVSPNHRKLAYAVDTTGFRDYTLHVKDLDSGALGPEAIAVVKSIAWAADSQTLFYTIDDAAKRPHRVYRHRLGDPRQRDALVYEEDDERFRVVLELSRSQQIVLIGCHSHTATEMRFIPAGAPASAPVLVAPREHEHEYVVEHGGDRLFILTNDRGRNFRLVTAPIDTPGRDHWQELLPHSERVMREWLDVFAGHWVLLEREDGLPHLRVGDRATGQSHRISFSEAAYAAYPLGNAEYDTGVYRFGYESLVTPRSVYEYDLAARQRRVLKQTAVLGGYDAGAYVTERLHATAADGVQVPISLVYRRGARDAGAAPMFLVGYGAYAVPYPLVFSHMRPSLLDRGVIFAVAHVRGGGELGRPWHDAGRMLHKRNTFTDFIACAEHLIDAGYTAPDQLAIHGASAGGLLMGAVANMRPELFKAVLSLVPFVDVLNTMLDPSLPLTVGEYEEWGNPQKREHYWYMRTYCPYTNIERKQYPAMFVRTAFNDSQVMYWEPAKYVAKLRAHATGDAPLLFHTDMSSGHAGASGRYDKLREAARDYAFILWQLGLLARAPAT